MTENLNTALIIFFIGMITVFIVLSMVVLTGRVLIYVVNTYFPAEIKQSPPEPALITTPTNLSSTISPSKLAAIVAAVEISTKGKGRITKIHQLDTTFDATFDIRHSTLEA